MHRSNYLVITLIFPLAIMLSGCFGFISVYSTECSADLPIDNYVYEKGGNAEWGEIRSKDAKDSVVFTLPTKEKFLELWGPPDEIIKVSESEEILVYNDKIWCGAIPAWLIMVPLILPVCEGFDRITFKDNQATHIYFKKQNAAGLILPWGPACDPNNCPQSQSNSQERTE